MRAPPPHARRPRDGSAALAHIFRTHLLREPAAQLSWGCARLFRSALVVIVGRGNVIGSDNGLGKRIIDSHHLRPAAAPWHYPRLGVLGYGLNLIFLGLEKWLVHWSGR